MKVQTLLGHSTSKMTQRYAHLSNESLMSAASCAGSLVGKSNYGNLTYIELLYAKMQHIKI